MELLVKKEVKVEQEVQLDVEPEQVTQLSVHSWHYPLRGVVSEGQGYTHSLL